MSKMVEVDDCYIDPDRYIAAWENRGSTSILNDALSYAERHWEVFPALIIGKTKKSHKSAENSNGRNWGKTTDPDEIRRDFQRWIDANIGIATGPDSAIFVVEADTPKGHDVDGIASLKQLEAEHGPLPETLMAESPSGSVHRYFKWLPGVMIRNSTSKIAPGVDVRGDGGMVIAPPSLRPGKGYYRWLNEGTPVADAPQWLIDLATADDDGAEHTPNKDLKADDPELIAVAFSVIPNLDLDWEEWNKRGMAIWAASGGTGFAVFDNWSKKSKKKYDAFKTLERWNHYFKSPATKIGAGSINEWANLASPGWQRDYDAKVEAAMAQVNRGPSSSSDSEIGAKKPQAETKTSAPADTAKPPDDFPTGPVDLWAKFDPPPLPSHLLPTVIRDFAINQGELMGTDPSGLAMAALTVCAAVIPDRIQLQVKRHDASWKECARIWTGLIGDPSTMKTPLMREAAKPARRIDIKLWRSYVEAKEKYDALSSEEKKTAERPRQTRLMIEDTTMEAAQEVLRDSPDGVLCYQDELSGWFGGMDRYSGHRGGMKDRGFWLQAYNGGASAFNRISRGSGVIENLSVSMLGGIQPDLMRKLAAETVDDGLLQRLIPIMLRPAGLGKDENTPSATEQYANLVTRLHEIREPFDQIRFDDGALVIRQDLEQRHLDLITFESVNKKLASHIGKYNGLFARLCLLWHCIESDQEELKPVITENTARRVADFLHDFLLPQAISFYVGILGLSDEHDRLTAVAGYILARKLDRITNRDVQRGDRTMRRLGKHEVEDIFHQLDALGWVIRYPGPRTSDPPYWFINPEVHQRFAERGKREEERRRREREMITTVLSKTKGQR